MKTAVVIPTEGEAYSKEVPEDDRGELDALKEIVGGYIELVPWIEDFTVWCNEEGKVDGLPINYRADYIFGIPEDTLVGNIVVLGSESEDGSTTSLEAGEVDSLLKRLRSITDADVERWKLWDDLRARKARATTDEERQALAEEEDALRDRGIAEMLSQDLKLPEKWFWISFADPDKPEGDQFLGVVVVQGGGMQEAIQNAWSMGINPGGQVMAFELLDDEVPDEQYRRRLMSKEELEEAGLV
jgi:hypothetical protein